MARLRLTKSSMVNGVPTKGFPLIITRESRVHWLALEYSLHLLRCCTTSSVKAYATHLLDFFDQLEADNKRVCEIDEQWLHSYKNAIRSRINSRGKRNTENYACQVIRTVVIYCFWLESKGHERLLCGETELHALQIRTWPDGSISHPLSIDKSKDKRSAHAPRSEWIELVKKYGPATDGASVKFDLMMDWCMASGTRAHEICCLTLDRLPARRSAQNAATAGFNLQVVLNKTKGGSNEPVNVSPVLVTRTWDFIDVQRKQTVSKFSRRAARKRDAYAEPAEVFVSEATGQGLTPKSLSNAVRRAFLNAVKAGDLTLDQRVWLHGLRHHYVTSFLKSLDSRGVKNPERIAKVGSRHRSVDSLDAYANERYNREFK